MRMAGAARDVLSFALRCQHLADIVPSSVRVLHDQQRVWVESSSSRQTQRSTAALHTN